ncbi:GntR family transcriptional regulator [Methylobacterium sp. ID0610]|uniref:GntR family transcriptional regulator n=1 Tax=Methylobacterium carpenticola TaxID=3344827 RepID=UPI00367AED06
MKKSLDLDRTAEARSAPEALAAEIRSRIWDGQLAPGQRLVESDLVLDLAASRGSVREALRLLVAQGLVTVEMHRGARVRRFSRAECLSLIEVREALEGLAARLAAERADPAGVARLGAIHREAEAAAADNDVEAYLRINDALHEAILDAGGNSMIREHLFLAQLMFFRVQTRFLRAHDLASAQREHAAIIAQIAARDGAGAEAAMRRHIGATREVVQAAPGRFFEPETRE